MGQEFLHPIVHLDFGLIAAINLQSPKFHCAVCAGLNLMPVFLFAFKFLECTDR